MKKQIKPTNNEINEKLKDLVITKIDAGLPSNLKISVGSQGVLTKEEMIQHVKKGDKQGRQIIDMHLNFMKALTSGEIMREINSI